MFSMPKNTGMKITMPTEDNGPIQISEFPDELIRHILIFLNDDKSLGIFAQLAKRYRGIVNEYFIKGIYQDAIHFAVWQNTQIKALEFAINSFKAKHTITFFNRPHDNMFKKIEHFIPLAVLSIFAVAPLVLLIAIGGKIKKSEAEKLLHQITLAILIIALVSWRSRMHAAEINDNRNANAQYQNEQLINQAEYDQLIASHQILFASDPDVESLDVNVSTIADVLKILNKALIRIEQNAKQTQNYLFSQRYSEDTQFNEKHLAHLDGLTSKNGRNFGKSGGRMLRFWIKNIRPSEIKAITTSRQTIKNRN